VAERQGGDGIDEEERGADQAELGVGEVELLLDRRRRGRGDPAVHVVEEVDSDHDGEDISRISSRHGGIIGVGYHYLSVSGSAGHWRAQVAVIHSRKLWWFKSLPAYNSLGHGCQTSGVALACGDCPSKSGRRCWCSGVRRA